MIGRESVDAEVGTVERQQLIHLSQIQWPISYGRNRSFGGDRTIHLDANK
jgi:hypothetical protein